MKLVLCLWLASLALANATFEMWTSKDGKSAEMELLSVSDVAGVLRADFRLKSGKTSSIALDKLSDEDSKRAKAWIEANKFARFVEFYIPVSFGSDPDSSVERGVNYEFLVETPGAFAADQKSLSITSFPPGSKAGKEKRESWTLRGEIHKHNTNAQYAKLPDGLLLSLVRGGGEFTRQEIDDSSFEASIEVLTSNTTEAATVQFKLNKQGKSDVKTLNGLKIWIEGTEKDPFQEAGDMLPVLRAEDPNTLSAIVSSSFASEGKSITRLQDARNSSLVATIQYRSDIRRQKVICRKQPKTPGLLIPQE